MLPIPTLSPTLVQQVALISEEVAGKQQTLREIASQIADVVVARAAAGKHYGVVLLPEGLIESVAELGPVIGTPSVGCNQFDLVLSTNFTHHHSTAEINELLARSPHLTYTDIGDLLTPASREIFGQLPVQIQLELLLERDTHGNVQIRDDWC